MTDSTAVEDATDLAPVTSSRGGGVRNALFWLAVSALVLGIIVAIDVVAGVVFGWGNIDLTTGEAFTLSAATEDSLRAVTQTGEPLRIEAYLAADAGLRLYKPSLGGRTEFLLRRYGERSPLITAEVYSQHLEGARFQAAERDVPGFVANSVVVRFRDRVESIPLASMASAEERDEVRDNLGNRRVVGIRYKFRGEALITAAIDRLRLGKQRKLYATVGHGEAHWDDASGADGLGQWRARLEGVWMKVEPLLLAQVRAIPEDCDVLVIAAPRSDSSGSGGFSEEEVDKLSKYLDAGGGILLLLNFGTDPKLARLMTRCGIVPSTSAMALDPAAPGSPGRADAFLAMSYGKHPITAGFGGLSLTDTEVSRQEQVRPTAWSDAVPVLPARPGPTGVEVTALVGTSEKGWGETEPLGSSTPRFDPGRDLRAGMPGAGVPIAMSAEIMRGGGRMVVFGSGRFLANEPIKGALRSDHPTWQANVALAKSALLWLAGEDRELANAPGRSARARLFVDEARDAHLFRLAFLWVPAFVIMVGLTVWARRMRHPKTLVFMACADVVFLLYLWLRVLAPVETF